MTLLILTQSLENEMLAILRDVFDEMICICENVNIVV